MATVAYRRSFLMKSQDLIIFPQFTMKINQFLHSAILVSNLEKANHFYGTVLELPQVERALKFAGTWYQIGEVQLHLIEYPQMIPDKVNDEKWGRNRHLAFAVDDIEAAQQRLVQYDYSFQMSSSGRAALFVEDPDGNIIELNQA
jgi:catechol 2,3-dioxygenase-like lactoylglutathione lyase family enzyme